MILDNKQLTRSLRRAPTTENKMTFTYSKIATASFGNDHGSFSLQIGDRIVTDSIDGIIIEIRKSGRDNWGNRKYLFLIFVAGEEPTNSLDQHTGSYHGVSSSDIIADNLGDQK